jgi:hypothetical protein
MSGKSSLGGSEAGLSYVFGVFSTLSVLLVAGCAHYSEEIATQQVAPSSLESRECAEIASETVRISTRLDELKKEVDEAAADDEMKTTVGILVFPPLLFFLNGDGAAAEEYGRLKGQYAALREASAQKLCPTANPA